MKMWFGALAGALLCPGGAAQAQGEAAAAPKAIPTEVLARSSLISGPALSPDGLKMLASLGGTNKSELGLRFIETGAVRRFALPKGFEVSGYRWAGDGRVLISLGKSTDYFGEQAYMTRLVAYDVATRQSEFIGKREQGLIGDDILYVDPAGAWILLSIQKTVYDWPSVYRVDLASGDMKEVVSPRSGTQRWFADASGFVRAGIGFDREQDRWKMIYRGPGGSFRTVSTGKGENVPQGELRFAPDSDQGFIVSAPDNGRDSIYAFDFSTLRMGALVYAAPQNDISGFALSRDGKTVEAAYYTDVRDRVQWFDPAMKEIQAALDGSVGKKEAWIVSKSNDRTRVLVLVTGTNDPGSYYYFHVANSTMQRLAQINPGVQGYTLAEAKPVSYKARDGLAIHGYLTLPRGRAAKGLPLIVMPHGGPYGVRDNGDYDPEVQLLANRGYAVLQPNYRGSAAMAASSRKKAPASGAGRCRTISTTGWTGSSRKGSPTPSASASSAGPTAAMRPCGARPATPSVIAAPRASRG
jgi:dipeptidyl aminopeptidase/acylaminoacyl peptidase